ncbi:MAG: hypothetical protein ABI812_07310 [Betaproteobacteria bacterium]
MLALVAATLFLRAFRRPSVAMLAAATIVACIGVLQRQVVAAVPFAFMVTCLWTQRPVNLRAIVVATAPFAAALAAQFAYRGYLASGPGIPQMQLLSESRLRTMLLDALAGTEGARAWVGVNAMAMAGYTGWLLAGFAAWWGIRLRRGFDIVLLG